MSFRTRKDQINADFAPQVMRAVRAEAILSTAALRRIAKIVRAELRGAAMVGAVEERDRTLTLVRAGRGTVEDIIREPVLVMLGL